MTIATIQEMRDDFPLGVLEDSTAEPPQRQTAVDSDGWIYEVSTGEIVGRADTPDRFAVDSDESADWALELRSRIEGEVAGITARMQALQANLHALHNAAVRRLSWWDWRFGPSLVEYAKGTLTGKSKTAQFNWGKVQFRDSAGQNSILLMDKAVEFVETWTPDKVQIKKSVSVKDLLAAIELAKRETGEEPETSAFLLREGPKTNVTITTGIDLKPAKGQ